MGEVMLYVNDWAALELQGYDGDRFPFDTWTHPVVELGDGTQVALLGKTERMLPTWVRVLGLESAPAQVTDDDLDVVCADPERALEVLREVIRGVPDAAAFEARQAGGAPVGAVLRSVRELGESEWAVARDVVTEVQPGVPIPRAPWRSSGASIGAAGPRVRVQRRCRRRARRLARLRRGPAVRALTTAGALRDQVL